MKNVKAKAFFSRNGSWILAMLGSIVLWILMGLSGNGITIRSLIDNAYTASFLAIAGLAQMLVVTTGRGAIDLSIPGMITLGAYVSMGVCNGSNVMIIPAILLVILLGILVGLLNSSMVIFLGIPAIIATMAMNYIIVTGTMLINNTFNVFTIPSILKAIVQTRVMGIPVIIGIVVILALLIHFLLSATSYGKSLLAMGQNLEAARLASVKVIKIEVLTYVFASVFAGIAGALISARVSGAYLGMGDNYQMESIACIVIGGTLMSGGRANAFGTLVGSLFLYLTISSMQLMGADAGIQSVVKGALIIALLLVGASENGEQRDSRRHKFEAEQA
ncbi:MAG: ABC transporter permease [Eubacteriales bacterium]|nr:ABC transporter permease [Eubacteriales bacterium]